MKAIKNIIVFDTEFVSARSGSQPIQIAMTAYELKENSIEKISDFSTFILPRKGVRLNKYVVEYTGINEEILRREGIYLEMARKQVIEYLLDFNFQDTILLGWDPSNDQRMFNILFNYNEEMIDVATFRWVDLARVYIHVNDLPLGQVPSLKTACEFYDMSDISFHDASNDCQATAILLSKLLELYGTTKCLYELSEMTVKKKNKRIEKQKVH